MDFANSLKSQPTVKNKEPIGFWLFIIAVALFPFAFGGNRPLPLALLQLSLVIVLLQLVWQPEELKKIFWPKPVLYGLCGLLCVAAWAIVQALPFSEQLAHPFWLEAENVLNAPLAASIALDTSAVFQSLARYLTYLAVGLIAFIYAQDDKRARLMIISLLSAGVLMAVYAVLAHASGASKVLWFEKTAHVNDMTGAFINRNHFAVYCGFMLVITAGLLIRLASQKGGQMLIVKDSAGKNSLQQLLLLAALLVLFIACLFYSHSRAGLVVGLLGIIVLLASYLFYLKKHRLALATACLLALLSGTLFIFFGDSIGRFGVLFKDYSSLDRIKVYTETVNAIQQSPWVGYGLGNFEAVFRFFRGENIGMNFNHAHSDWLESIFDLGLPAALLLWLSIATLLASCARGILRRRQNGIYPALALGTSAVILPHAAVEFSLQMPGLVVLWATFMGIGVAQSWGQRDRHNG